VVTAALEIERTGKVIGSSLEASPIVFTGSNIGNVLKDVDFAEICITSGMEIRMGELPPMEAFRLPEDGDILVLFRSAPGEKCQRCWKILPEVNTLRHPHTCARCNAALG
jgi:isoleucyl-tRNA synthetase